jgi:hypothetical protein
MIFLLLSDLLASLILLIICCYISIGFCAEDIMEAFNKWKFKETLPDDAHKKVGERFIGFWCEFLHAGILIC